MSVQLCGCGSGDHGAVSVSGPDPGDRAVNLNADRIRADQSAGSEPEFKPRPDGSGPGQIEKYKNP